MRYIDTTQVVDPNIEQPFLAPSLDFLTKGQIETLNALALAAIGSSYSIGTVYVLYGCVVTGVTIGAGTFSISAGAVFNQGQIYHVPATTFNLTLGQRAYSQFNVAPTTVDPIDGIRPLDPVRFSDGIPRDCHYTLTWVPYPASSGSFYVGDWVYLPGLLELEAFIAILLADVSNINTKITALQTPIMRQLAVANPATPGGSFADIDPALSYTTPNDGITRNFMIVAKTTVASPILGAGTSASAEFRLYDGSTLDTCSWFISTPVTYSQLDSVSPITLCWVGSLPPNTTISFQGMSANILGISNATLSIAQLGSPS